ncbi:tetratricopeptide repeat protein [Iodobacter arcticus]|uniref:Tetratricopeptide repeat protein n=1 Tax=Iodobacter arcticus TaxID=590593 RepID=A0ABW2QXS2_9NEIS
MSLLLQALKKAEEAKRLREAAGLNEELAIANEPEDATPEKGLSSPLELIAQVDAAAPLVSLEASAAVEMPEEWVFVPVEISAEKEEIPEPVPVTTEPLLADPEPPLAPVQVAVPEEESWLKAAASPPPVEPQAVPLATLAPTVSPPPPVPASPAQALSKPRLRSKTFPWLVLCGVVIAGAMGGYFWWQYQSLSVSPVMPSVPAAAAPLAEPDIISPPSPALPVAQMASLPAAPIASAASALTPPVATLAKRASVFKGDAASVEERSGAPNGAGIRFDTQNAEAAVPLPLAMAYRSFQQGDYRAAEEGYRRMLQLDARNRDALLGMAAVAIKRGAGAEAAHFYRQILSLYPRDEVAQSALYSLTPGNENSESGLRQLSGQHADAAFALANLYAGQNRWSEAQSAYFQALILDVGNADYAFNLAISLEHLQENKTAARYYRQALAGKGSFDRTIAEARLKALESQ